MTVVIGAPTVSGLVETFTIELPYSGDPSDVAACSMRYQDPSTGQWRNLHVYKNKIMGRFQGLGWHPTPYALQGRTVPVEITVTSPEGGGDVLSGSVVLDPAEPPAGATQYFVDPLTGNDSFTGSESNPWRTLANVPWFPGVVVNIRPTAPMRSFSLLNLKGTPASWMTIRADPSFGGHVLIDGLNTDGIGFYLANCEYLHLKGIDVKQVLRSCFNAETNTASGVSRRIQLTDCSGDDYGTSTWDSFFKVESASNVYANVTGMRVLRCRATNSKNPIGSVFGTFFAYAGGGHSILYSQVGAPGARPVRDGFGGAPNSDYPGTMGRDTEIVRCVADGVYDDGFEIDGPNELVRLIECESRNTPFDFSFSTMGIGPCWLLRPKVVDLRPAGTYGWFLKLGSPGAMSPAGKLFVLHSSIYAPYTRKHFLANAGGGRVFYNHEFWNNAVVLGGQWLWGMAPPPNWTDYNCIRSIENEGGGRLVWVEVDATSYFSLSSWQAKWGMDAHSIQTDPLFVDGPNGDLALRNGSPAIDRAVPIVGINDDFQGSGPDMGAVESLGVSGPVPVEAIFTADKTQGFVPLTVIFTDASTGPVVSWFWNFGDGGTSTEKAPIHIYTEPAPYTVVLTVTGDIGQTGSSQMIVEALAIGAPVGSFTAVPTTGAAPLQVTFTNTSEGQIDSYEWSFGDGETSTARDPIHVYQSAGFYNATLTARGPGGVSTVGVNIEVGPAPPPPAPVAFFSAQASGSVAPVTVTFTDQSSGEITSRVWDFGDGSPTVSDVLNPVHIYQISGVYTTILEVIGPGGTSRSSLAFSIFAPTPPVARFSSTPLPGSPLTIAFINESVGQIDSITWEFGDGRTSIEESPTHTYLTPGQYVVTLTVRNIGGETKQTQMISVSSAIVASFTANPTSGPVPLNVVFTDTSTGEVTAWEWDFGDLTAKSTTRNPDHLYTKPGTYTVMLKVGGTGGTSTASATVIVTELGAPEDGKLQAVLVAGGVLLTLALAWKKPR